MKKWICLFLFLTESCLLSNVVSAYDIKGIVYQPNGKPASDVDIWLVHAIQGTATKKSDREGNFIFSNYNFGEVTIVARDNKQRIGGSSFVLMQDEREINISLIEGVKQKLKVYNHNLSPISGAYIRRFWIGDKFCIPAEELAEQGYGWLRSNDEGEIILPCMPMNGFIKIVVSHVDYADAYLPFIPVNENKTMDIILQKGTLIRGRVVKDDKGIKDALVVPLQKGANNLRFILPVKTDKEGLYRCHLDRGEYRIFATHPDYPNTIPKEISITNITEEEIVIDFTFQNPLYLQGKVLLYDGTPCKLAKITTIEEKGVEDFVFTNEKGEYVLKSNSEKLKVKILPPPGYITEELPEIPVDFKGEKRITMPLIRVKKLPEIQGKIMFNDGKEGDRVFIYSTNLELPFYAITDNDGKFQILLGITPDVNPVHFVAEHALRFVKSEFVVDMYKENKPLDIVLNPYEPNQDKFVNKERENRLLTLIDKPAPDIKCRTWFNFKGNQNPLRDMEGKVILLLFWGGFDRTPLGRKHIEEMRALFDLYKGISDVQLLSIHDGTFDDDEIQNYIKEYGIEFPVGVDTDDANTFIQYTIDFIPQFILIDKKGIIRYSDVEGRAVELIKVLRRL
ncbi:MAG: redoxin domain-containing protein [Candidatus Hydrogenedens sp.]